MWRAIRIFILLIVLVLAAGVTWVDRLRTTRWTDTMWIGVFPVNGDGRPATGRYIGALTREQFTDIEDFFGREAHGYGIALDRPVRMELYPEVTELPPRLEQDASVPRRIWWSLRMRYYTWRKAGDTLADIRVFVLYNDPGRVDDLPHSLGVQKGLMGVVYAYAADDMSDANEIVIAHEVMHTLGATDKYDPVTNLPTFPEGYGDPLAEPRYPQAVAEIMAGRTALSPTEAGMPGSLEDVVVGRETAVEVNWAEAGSSVPAL